MAASVFNVTGLYNLDILSGIGNPFPAVDREGPTSGVREYKTLKGISGRSRFFSIDSKTLHLWATSNRRFELVVPIALFFQKQLDILSGIGLKYLLMTIAGGDTRFTSNNRYC